MSQILNITTTLHNESVIHIQYSNIISIKHIQILHKCNHSHNEIIRINCNLLENEDNYGLLGHIFTNSKLDINDDPIYIDKYTDTIKFWLSDNNDNPINIDEDIYINLMLLLE